jgi:two-component system chemotaxis response regulator CheY
MGQNYLILEAIEAGARDFVVTPYNEERILEAIEKSLPHQFSN